jgi:acetoin utilization deacetylase AcuC-like enzyme
MEFLLGSPVWPYVGVHENFGPVVRGHLLTAHELAYVDAFLGAELPLCESNGLAWSEALRDSVLMTNGSLVAAITGSIARPDVIAMSPSSGFHHAGPEEGQGFCTFSGQVIAALQLYRTRGLVGAWIDLDGHHGNSIEDTREFAPDLDRAIPRSCNLNPVGDHEFYLRDLACLLEQLGRMVTSGQVHYVCVAHGADSHEWDQLGHQCNTAEWLQASDLVYSAIRGWSETLGCPVPVTLALFGGYRDDHPASVLGLHAMDAARALVQLGGVGELAAYQAEVRPR